MYLNKNETKKSLIKVRVSHNDHDKIKQLAKSHNLSVSAYVRMVLLSGGEK